MRAIWIGALTLGCGVAAAQTDLSAAAARNRDALRACWRFVQGWGQFADPETGLYPRRLTGEAYWNAKDCAADCYPFLVLSARYTDAARFEVLRGLLDTEQRVCNRLDRLPDDYDFATRTFRTPEYRLDDLIFGASEYCKDGLLPLTELLGPTAWTERMIGLVDDVWKHAAAETEAGVLPSASHEVAGDLLQATARLAWMTGEARFKEWCYRLAEYFLVHHPPHRADKLRLDDHGCEVIAGLSEAYFLASKQDPARADAWRPTMHAILDRVLEVARDEHGLLYNLVDPVRGKVLDEDRTDNWGYNYNAFAVVARLDGVARYDEAVRHVLRSLGAARDYPWEGGRMDGFADAIEGAINLYNRYREPEAAAWIEHTADRLLATQRATGVFEGWYGDGNGARTLLMYALYLSRGLSLHPWRADLGVAAVEDGNGLRVTVVSEWPWQGRLVADRPRHAQDLKLPEDYPRLNQFPEWHTALMGIRYRARIADGETTLSGDRLSEGIEIELGNRTQVQVVITPMTPEL